MTTIQRSESTNYFLKRFLKRKYNIWRFFKGFEKFVEHQHSSEVDEDFNSRKSYPVLWADVDMIAQVAKVYTRNVYSMFEE